MPTRGEAVSFLEEHAQEMFGEVRSMLYVGHRSDTSPWWRTTFAARLGLLRGTAIPAIDIVDIAPGNLPHELVAEGLVRSCFHGDIRTSERAVDYDLVFWDEGPEHVSREDALRICDRLRDTNGHVLISCPWGDQPQGSGPEDPEFHHWAPQPEDWRSIGFRAEVFGEMFDGRGGGHGNLIAWR